MIQEYKETCWDMLCLWLHPKQKFHELAGKPISLRPLLVLLLVLFLCSFTSSSYLHIRAQQLLASGLQGFQGSQELLVQIAQTDMIPYGISIFFAPLLSILMVAIILFIMATLSRSETTFRQNVVLVCYAWTPMIFASILMTLLSCISPVAISMVAQSIYDYVIPAALHDQSLYLLLTRVDPFYLWTLGLMACGCSVLYQKGGRLWYLVLFVVMELPAFLSLM